MTKEVISIKEDLEQQRNTLLSNKYRSYTKQVFKFIGDKLKKEYNGVDFLLQGRYKSEQSFKGKLEKKLKKEDEINVQIYDIIGFEIIVQRNLENRDNKELADEMLGHILGFFDKNPKYGINRVPDRQKKHIGGDTGFYIATHDAIESIHFTGWKAEIKAFSLENYLCAIQGKAKHSLRKGKERKLLRLPEGSEKDKLEFLRRIEKEVPKFIIYRPGEDIYECSMLENFYCFYKEMLLKDEKYFNMLMEQKILDNSEAGEMCR